VADAGLSSCSFLVYPALHDRARLYDTLGNPSPANFVGFFTTDETLVALRNTRSGWSCSPRSSGAGLCSPCCRPRPLRVGGKVVMFMPLATSSEPG
jgi:hypothetical protein